MRYWVNKEDEDERRERERASRFGGDGPAPLARSAVAATILLVAGEVALFIAFAAVIVLSFN